MQNQLYYKIKNIEASVVKQIIKELELKPHPEGGYYREVFRSENSILMPGTGRKRSAVTTIYYLLEKGQYSRFHKVSPDEIWHHYGGEALELFIYNERRDVLTRAVLNKDNLVCVVPGGCWQAARTLGEYTLTGCTVAPAFEFEDFRFIEDEGLKQSLSSKYPELEYLI